MLAQRPSDESEGRVTMLDVHDVSISFEDRPLLDQVSLHLEPGEVVALLGPSGSGKSTLLRIIAGLITPESGAVRVDGVDMTNTPTHHRSVGMVFQDEQLFPHLSVADNVTFGLKMAGVPRAQRRRRADEMLELVGMAGFGDRQVGRLSGGEAKRVALARSLAPSPKVLLLDEPLTGLDRELHDRLALEVASILRRAETTAVWVTHDPVEADTVADRIVQLGDRDDDSDELHIVSAEIVDLSAEDTHALRRTILRDGTAGDVVVFDGDDLPTTLHLGAVFDSKVVAISTWLVRDHPDHPDRSGVQLRGMATAPEHRGSDISAEVLEAGIARSRDAGADFVWARARVAALNFYLRHGFDQMGDEYIDSTTGLAHHDIFRLID